MHTTIGTNQSGFNCSRTGQSQGSSTYAPVYKAQSSWMSSQFTTSLCSEHTYSDHFCGCLLQLGTKCRGEGILRMEDAGTLEEGDTDSQDSNTLVDHGHLAWNLKKNHNADRESLSHFNLCVARRSVVVVMLRFLGFLVGVLLFPQFRPTNVLHCPLPQCHLYFITAF